MSESRRWYQSKCGGISRRSELTGQPTVYYLLPVLEIGQDPSPSRRVLRYSTCLTATVSVFLDRYYCRVREGQTSVRVVPLKKNRVLWGSSLLKKSCFVRVVALESYASWKLSRLDGLALRFFPFRKLCRVRVVSFRWSHPIKVVKCHLRVVPFRKSFLLEVVRFRKFCLVRFILLWKIYPCEGRSVKKALSSKGRSL